MTLFEFQQDRSVIPALRSAGIRRIRRKAGKLTASASKPWDAFVLTGAARNKLRDKGSNFPAGISLPKDVRDISSGVLGEIHA
jgi:hypothetical protein